MIPDWMIPEPWELEADEERRERQRGYDQRYRQRPGVRARRAAYLREWRQRNIEKVRAAKRERRRWRYQNDPEYRERILSQLREARQRKKRARSVGPVIGGLHELACTGPHPSNTRCRPIPVYAQWEAAA